MKKAVAYARFSSHNQREESIDAQLRAIRDYCKRNNLELIDTYVDEGISGRTDDRPEFQKMIKDSEKRIFDFVVVHKLDRFTRSKYDAAIYKRKLRQNGVRVLSVLENLDDSPESVILESVLEGMSQYYSENLAREVKKGHNENAYKALHNGGIPPLGYDVVDQRYVINFSEAQAVKIIFSMFAEGKGYSEISAVLNQKGYKTKKGKSFGKNSLYEILRNRKYLGEYVYNRRVKNGNSYNNHANSQDMIIIKNALPRIIDDETWDIVDRRRNENKRRRSNFMKGEKYLLSGKIRHECGAVMEGTKRTNKKGFSKHYYRCTNKDCEFKPKSYQAEKIENEIIEALNKNLFIDDKMHLAENLYLDMVSEDDEEELLEMNKELEKILKAEKNITNAIMAGIITDDLKEKSIDLKKQKESIRDDIKNYKLSHKKISLNDIKKFITDVGDLKKYSKDEQRRIIDQFIYKIKITPTELKVLLYREPFAGGSCSGRGERI